MDEDEPLHPTPERREWNMDIDQPEDSMAKLRSFAVPFDHEEGPSRKREYESHLC
jgi:hypothetical protein